MNPTNQIQNSLLNAVCCDSYAVRPSYETYGRSKGIKKSSIEYNTILALDYIIGNNKHLKVSKQMSINLIRISVTIL